MFRLFVATPEKILLDEMILSLTVPGGDGNFQVLKNHAPLISTLKAGTMALTDQEQRRRLWRLSGGLIEVLHNTVTLLADSAEPLPD